MRGGGECCKARVDEEWDEVAADMTFEPAAGSVGQALQCSTQERDSACTSSRYVQLGMALDPLRQNFTASRDQV